MKKSILLLGLLICFFSCSVQAASGFCITIDSKLEGHQYEAYQIFGGRAETLDGKTVLSDVKFGDGIDQEAFLDLLGQEELYKNALTAKEIAKVLEGLNASQMRSFSELADQALLSSGAKSFSWTGSDYILENLDPGYYLVKDENSSLNNTGLAYTKFIVQTVGDIEVEPKNSMPVFEKKVYDSEYEESDSDYGQGYNDAADYDLNTLISFRHYVTIPDNIEDYSVYSLTIHDQQEEGLTFDNLTSVTMEDRELNTACYELVTENLEDGCSFEIRFGNLKNLTSGASKLILQGEERLVVSYQAHLNEKAQAGISGNRNKAYLEFSNNPNSGYEADRGKTAEDEVAVFTYQLDVSKVSGEKKPLEGAQFLLKKEDSYALVENGKLAGWTAKKESASVLESNASGMISLFGLEDQNYELEEIKAPAGYNQLTLPISFSIHAQMDHTQNWNSGMTSDLLTGLSIQRSQEETASDGKLAEGLVALQVINEKGTVLPSTGASGTRLFTVIGIGLILISSAGFLLHQCLRKSA